MKCQKNNAMRFFSIIFIFIIIVEGCSNKGTRVIKRTYYSSGELKSCGVFIKDSIPVDTLINLFRNGRKSSLEIYSGSGKIEKILSYYQNGNLNKIINYKRGVVNGFFLTYDSTGKLLNKAFYYNGNQIGDTYFYYEDSLIYNFYDWEGENISQIIYDRDFKILNDQRQAIFIDSVKFNNDTTTVKNNNIINVFHQDILVLISNPPKCKTDITIKYISNQNILMEEDSTKGVQLFHIKTSYQDSLAEILISGQQYDSITKKTTYQTSTKTLKYNSEFLPTLSH